MDLTMPFTHFRKTPKGEIFKWKTYALASCNFRKLKNIDNTVSENFGFWSFASPYLRNAVKAQ